MIADSIEAVNDDEANPGRVLIVDDTPGNVKILEDLLVYHGFDVEVAVDGESALEHLHSMSPDVLLLDVMLPGISGFEVCRRIRADARHALLPVVMVTALDSRDERVEGLEAGADDFLSKPVNPPELLARVRSLLRIRRLYETVQRQAEQLASWNRTLEARVAEQVAHVERLSRLKRFFSPQLTELILAGGADDPLQSHRREITVVFLDLRGFSTFAEAAEPEEVMRALREFHSAMGSRILEYQATLERFTGDGMMVFFNDPLPINEPARRAVEMAFAMQGDALKLSAQWKKRGYVLGLGIGIAQGYATVGAIGFEGRIDYGAIGTVTNLANRLCDLAGPGDILAAQRVHAEVEALVFSEDLGEVPVLGLARPAHAFKLLDYRDEKR
ncbi:Adenylate cyclase 2 [Usitatibacter rugosus]|uniref:Adenylate cyclase 2 n=1 Tax=Usitatibacter rugosus TaxID=2732067 RepID=A0A6M4GWE5_9PROT|nr:response regulator [Usitatibacter rugosus]QJR10673.1 Adenylate cyclase 2 [Usitatibacter rugosus]